MAKVIVTIPAQKFTFDLDALCIGVDDTESILEYVVLPATKDAESDWEVVE